MRLSVVIPVYNGGAYLGRTLSALAASTRPPDEVIVVDNGSTDQSGALARDHGACVLTLAQSHGPAVARNRGAAAAGGDVLVFIDADVAVHADALGRIEQALGQHPEIAGVFGSYDDDPPGAGLASRYKNLLHHYVHQHGHREALTFWTGCGAIRRAAFEAVGGFDEAYARPSIEDIDLGARLRRAGQRVWLLPDVQATHLKRWSLRHLLRSDVHDRAVPWTQLILREGYLPGDLNLDVRSRISALLAWLLVVCLLAGAGAAWLLPIGWLAAAALVALNFDLYRFFARHGGAAFMLGAMSLHFLYLLYGSFIFGALSTLYFLTHPPARRRAFILLLILTLIKGWLWSALVPPWQASDEDQHFGYAQEVARQQTWPVAPPAWTPIERVWARDLANPEQLSAQREPLDLSPENRAQIELARQQLADPLARNTLTSPPGFPGFVRQHPPLYYTLQAVVQQLAAAEPILTRLAWMRCVSVLLGLGTVICAYGAARALWPDRPELALAAAALVSFHPSFTFFTSVVNNAALEMLAYALTAWLLIVIARQGLTLKRAGLLGLVLAAGLLTKSSFLAALPLVLAVAAWDVIWRRRKTAALWLLVGALPLALAGWWYAGFFASAGGDLIDVYKSAPPQRTVPLFDYLLHYPWLTRYRPFLPEWWAAFGWRDTFLPEGLYAVLNGTLLLAAAGGLWAARQRRRADVAAWLLGGAATVGLIVFYTALDYRLALAGGAFKIQGRYFLAAIVPQMLALLAGWAALWRGRRMVLLTLCAGLLALNTFALVGVILPRYYGAQITARHAPYGQPVTLTDESVSRAVTLTPAARLDVWLKPLDADSQVTLTVRTAQGVLAQETIAAARMIAPYPTTVQVPAAASDVEVVVTGAGLIRVAADGQLAVSVFEAVPWGTWLDRAAVLQPPGRSAALFFVVIVTYVAGQIALIALLARRAV